MAITLPRWDPKYPGEIIPLGVDFVDLLSTGDNLIAVEAAVTVLSGTDAAPGDMLLGSPAISGTTGQQWIKGGVSGCSYRLAFTADSLTGKRLIEMGRIDVI